MPEHSPLPWQVTTDEQNPQPFVADANGLCVLEMEWTPHEIELADWNLIVRCVNVHSELVKALGKLVGECKDYDKWDRSATKNDLKRVYGEYDALLAKAKGET